MITEWISEQFPYTEAGPIQH